MSASAFSLSAMVPATGFDVVDGIPVRGGAHSEGIEHYHCPHCKSWLFTRMAMLPDLVNVRSVMFDVPEWTQPFIETMTKEKLAWAQTPAVHSYEGFPQPADFGPLLAEYAARA